MSTNDGEAQDGNQLQVEHKTNSSDIVTALSAAGEVETFANLPSSGRPSDYARDQPITVLVGPERSRYFVHKSLLAAKSPFFRTMFKNCWDGKKEEVELSSIENDGFSVVIDWMYSARLPDCLREFSESSSYPWGMVLDAYKAADILMIDELQNDIIANEITIFLERKLKWSFSRLRIIYDADLCHTKYYNFVLKSAVANMMLNTNQSTEKWEENMKDVENKPQLLADLIRTIRDWTQRPWKDFPQGSLAEFLVKREPDESQTS